MDFGSIAEFLRNKTIFVTGATGFIAKSKIFLFSSLSINGYELCNYCAMNVSKKIFVVPTCTVHIVIAVLLEKILRVQPNVKRLYLLVRATDANSADSRLRDEVCRSTSSTSRVIQCDENGQF